MFEKYKDLMEFYITMSKELRDFLEQYNFQFTVSSVSFEGFELRCKHTDTTFIIRSDKGLTVTFESRGYLSPKLMEGFINIIESKAKEIEATALYFRFCDFKEYEEMLHEHGYISISKADLGPCYFKQISFKLFLKEDNKDELVSITYQ